MSHLDDCEDKEYIEGEDPREYILALLRIDCTDLARFSSS